VAGMLLITLGLFACLYLLIIFGEKIFPILGGLTFAEASVECDLMEDNSRWSYDGGFDDCVDYYISDELISLELIYNILPIGFSAFFAIVFIVGGVLLLCYPYQKKKSPTKGKV
tara:strand:- start:250 stop:591 length:342 start_codon:yes stop_codon:yes gene_type:complete